MSCTAKEKGRIFCLLRIIITLLISTLKTPGQSSGDRCSNYQWHVMPWRQIEGEQSCGHECSFDKQVDVKGPYEGSLRAV